MLPGQSTTLTKKYILFSALVALDQLLKFLISRPAVSSNRLNYICNENIAWSIHVAPGLFYFFWVVIFLFLIFMFSKSNLALEKLALVLIISGAASNLIDRLSRGCVIDFIDLKFWPASIATRSVTGWPVFNLADVYITIGVLLLLFATLKSQYQNPNIKSNPKSKN